MKWIKASERLPEKMSPKIIFRQASSKTVLSFSMVKDWVSDGEIKYLEWLDESAPVDVKNNSGEAKIDDKTGQILYPDIPRVYGELKRTPAPVDDVVSEADAYNNDHALIAWSKLSDEVKDISSFVDFADGFNSRQPEVDELIRERDILKGRCENWEIIDKQNEKTIKLFEEENAALKKRVEELEGIANGIEEGADFWKSEYDACRAILSLLVQLKVEKDTLGKTDFYIQNQPLAWMEAKEFLKKYQHH